MKSFASSASGAGESSIAKVRVALDLMIFLDIQGQGRRVFRRIWWRTVATARPKGESSTAELSIDLESPLIEADTRKISLNLPVQAHDRSGLSNQDHWGQNPQK